MNPEQFFFKVKEMREAQKEYFKYRMTSALQKSKRLEAEVDKEIKRAIQIKNDKKQLELFDNLINKNEEASND